MRVDRQSLFACLVVWSCAVPSSAQDTAPERLPGVTARWEDVEQREVFIVEGQRYQVRLATRPARILSVRVDGVDVLGPNERIDLAFDDERGRRWAVAPGDARPNWVVWRGRSWRPKEHTDAPARVSVWSASPFHVEAHVLDVPLISAAEPDLAQPMRGELVFHAHPDRVHLELRAEPIDGLPRPARALLTSDAPARAFKVGDRAVAVFGRGAASVALLAPPAGTFDVAGGGAVAIAPATTRPAMIRPTAAPIDPPDARPTSAASPGNAWVLRPVADDADLAAAFAPELEPLPVDALRIENGRWLGYDAASGLYVAEATLARASRRADPTMEGDPVRRRAADEAEAAHRSPNRRIEVPIAIANDAVAGRPITVRLRAGTPALAGAVVADRHGFPTGIPSFVCRNYEGDREEPHDPAWGDVYFPLTLAAREERRLVVIGLFERWGDHLAAHVSSLRLADLCWHVSTGLRESTTVSHAAKTDWRRWRDWRLYVPDFRSPGEPSRTRLPARATDGWPGLLRYQAGHEDVRLVHRGTTFRSSGPNLVDMTMRFRTSDGAATASARFVGVPHGDAARTFVTLRYDWARGATIDGDARQQFRWLSVAEDGPPPATLEWLDADRKPQATPIVVGEPTLNGEPLFGDGAFLGTHGAAREQADPTTRDHPSMVLVRRFAAKLGGVAYDSPSASALFDKDGGAYWFGAPADALELKPGDFIEADVMLMPHVVPTPPGLTPMLERQRWPGRGPFVHDVTLGTKRADFPAHVDGEAGGATLTLDGGGHDALTVTAGNFQPAHGRPGVPLLWRGDAWIDVQSHGGDGHQIDRDEDDGTYRFTFVVPQRNGLSQRLSVTRVASSAPVARLHDVNGRPRVTAEAESDFELLAPILFGPGVNRAFAGESLVKFKGRGTSVTGLPIRAKVERGEASVRIDDFGTDRLTLTKTGDAATLTIGELSDGATYALTINGVETRVIAENEAIEVALSAGEATLELRR